MLLELFTLILCLIFYKHYNKRKNLPPGPPSLPIIGTLISMNVGNMVSNRELWKYKDMCTLFLGPHVTAIVINDFQRAKDLFFRDEFSGKVFENLCLKKKFTNI